MELHLAQKISEQIIKELQPYCEVCLVAGSVRRKVKEPNDIEIVLIRRGRTLADFKHLIDSWTKISGEATGRMTSRYYRYKELDYQVDIFMPQPNDFWRQFVIRTGSSNFSYKQIACGWEKLGWRGTEDGLRKESECTWKYTDTAKKKKKWICVVNKPTLPPIWQSEKEFFQWLQIPYVEPENRF